MSAAARLLDPTLHARLATAVHRRHDALRDTAGLNEEVFDSLVLLAAGTVLLVVGHLRAERRV